MCFFYSFYIAAQNVYESFPDDIIYYTIGSDFTERDIFYYIKDNGLDKNDICIFIGSTSAQEEKTTLTVLVVLDTPDDYTSFLKVNSKRYITVNHDFYPVIFDLDFLFAEGDTTSKYIKFEILGNENYQFVFPEISEQFEIISMGSIDTSKYILDEGDGLYPIKYYERNIRESNNY